MNSYCALCRSILRRRQFQPKSIRLQSSRVVNNDESRFERPAATEGQGIESRLLQNRPAIADMVRAGFTGDSKRFIERFDAYKRAGNLKSATSAELEQILQSMRTRRSQRAFGYNLREIQSQNEAVLNIMLKIKRTMVMYSKVPSYCSYLYQYRRNLDLSTNAYGSLLDSAIVAQDETVLRQLANEIRRLDSVNIELYNKILRALCGSPHFPRTRRKLDAQTRNNDKFDEPSNEYGDLATDIVDEMVTRGIQPDVQTFEMLFNAYVKDGNLTKMAEVVADTWPHIKANDDQSSLILHLRPTQFTLHHIMNGFGLKCDFENALSTGFNISNAYDVPIHISTWIQLLRHAAQCSRSKTVSSDLLPIVFDRLISEPYLVEFPKKVWFDVVRHEIKFLRRQSANEYLKELWRQRDHKSLYARSNLSDPPHKRQITESQLTVESQTLFREILEVVGTICYQERRRSRSNERYSKFEEYERYWKDQRALQTSPQKPSNLTS